MSIAIPAVRLVRLVDGGDAGSQGNMNSKSRRRSEICALMNTIEQSAYASFFSSMCFIHDIVSIPHGAQGLALLSVDVESLR